MVEKVKKAIEEGKTVIKVEKFYDTAGNCVSEEEYNKLTGEEKLIETVTDVSELFSTGDTFEVNTDSDVGKAIEEAKTEQVVEAFMNLFEYKSPTPESVEKIKAIRKGYKELAALIAKEVPYSDMSMSAINKLEESSMWCNKAIVFYQEGEKTNEGS